MSQTHDHKATFLVTVALIFLLPVFFVPGGALDLYDAKSALLAFGVIIAALVFSIEVWRQGKISFPKHYFLLAAILLPLVYLLSALLTTPASLSLLGYNFEVGTFGYMLFGSVLLLLSAMSFSDTTRVLQALMVFFVSISLVALFVSVKIFSGMEIMVWGNFFGNLGNPIGNWTDLAVSFGLLAVFAALTVGMIPMKRLVRAFVYLIFLLSTALLAIINFPTAFALTLGASIFLLIYFKKTQKKLLSKSTFLPLVLGIISIIFLVNPTISATRGTLANVMADTFKVDNTDVRPSLSATLGISKSVLSEVTLLGSGPNTFSRDWLIFKPADINTTPFWAIAFPFGVGFIPTQIASTGVLGTILWLTFFILFALLGVKSLSKSPEPRDERFALVSAFLISLFLWISSFLYTPSAVVLMLAFIFSGIFVAASRHSGIISSRSVSLKESAQARFALILFLVTIVLGTLSLGWVGFGKTASAYHFKKAVTLSGTAGASSAEIENELGKAIKFAPVDMHFIALSRINFAKAQIAANSATGTPETNQAIFEDSLKRSIEAARNAVTINPASYQNWVSLGMVYSALVPAPLSIEGAYENAQFAYNEAYKRNPSNPELPLLLAQLELQKKDANKARSYIMGAIALKQDYADAYLMLAQLEIQENNIAAAITSTENLAFLMPNNSGILLELGLLKYSNKDYTGAVNTFNKALTITPDYANAKYYLGLTHAQLGHLDKAIEQFEALSKSNPDSEEVRMILGQLRAGDVSFLRGPATAENSTELNDSTNLNNSTSLNKSVSPDDSESN